MKQFHAGVSVIALLVLMAPTAGYADSVEDEGLHEIIVTAQKRQDRINDVPLSIVALSAEELKSRNVVEPQDLAHVVPGFDVQTTFTGAPVFYIRGVGFSNYSLVATPAVTVYSDEAPLTFSAMAKGAALDVERVEILKGPQGTLFGQNSTGGAVNFIAAKPSDTFEGGTTVGAGRFAAANIESFLSGPVTDNLSLRVAGEYRTQGDWQYSATRPGDTRGQQDFLNGRFSALFKPTGYLNFLLTVTGWRDHSDAQPPQLTYIAPQVPFPPIVDALQAAAYTATNARITDWPTYDSKRRDASFKQVVLRGDIDLSDTVKVTSISAYSRFDSQSPDILNGESFASYSLDLDTARVFSQELRLSGEVNSFRWMLGGNYQNVATADNSFVKPVNATNSQGLYNSIHQLSEEKADDYGVFANLERNLIDAVTARGSVRYTVDNRSHLGCLADFGDGQLAAGFGQVVIPFLLGGVPTNIPPGDCVTLDDATKKAILSPAPGKLDQTNVSWRTGLDWKAAADTLVYATVAKGFKSGGYTQLPAVYVSQMNPVTQESVLAYELGLKSDLFDRKAHIDLAAFYNDYKDKQLQGYVNIVPFGPLPTLVNIPSSRIAGAELTFTALPTRGLRVQLAGTFLDTKIRKDPTNPRDPFGAPTSFVGESFPNTPKYQASLDAEQTIPISDRTSFYLGGDLQYHGTASGSFGSDSSDLAHSLLTLKSYVLLDLRAGVRLADPKLSVELWGTNLTDKYYYTAVSQYVDTFTRFPGQPAMYGIRFTYRY